jgi:hypothetical protein
MDAINKNFPVGQPDANGNYEWMQVRAGGGINVTGDVEVNDGDLQMNGGTIRNANFVPPIGGGGDGPIYAVNTPPLILGITSNQTFPTGTGSPMVWDEIVSKPINPAGGNPYAVYFGPEDIRIYEPGAYEFTLQVFGYMDNPVPLGSDGTTLEMKLFINGFTRMSLIIGSPEVFLASQTPGANVLGNQEVSCVKKTIYITPSQIALPYGDHAKVAIGKFFTGPDEPNCTFTFIGASAEVAGHHLASIRKVADY